MYQHVHTRLNDVRTRLYHCLYIPCTYHVHTCIYICRNAYTCMYISLFFNNCIYHVCQLLYYSIVHTLYKHGTDMSVHVYARWPGFQMQRIARGIDTAAEDGRCGSNVYEVNTWLWQFGRGKPRLGGLTMEETGERQDAARKESDKRRKVARGGRNDDPA